MVTINLDKPTGKKIKNKIGFFNSGMVPIERYERDFHLIKRLNPHSLRVDLYMGDREMPMGDIVDGTIDNIIYHFGNFDHFIMKLKEYDIIPYISWCYNPLPLQPKGGDFRSFPVDEKKYYEIIQTLSTHLKELMGDNEYYEEIYNEADCNDIFFTGEYEQYLKLYEIGSKAISDAGGNALIGGPAEAYVLSPESIQQNIKNFLSYVKERKLRLDFFSFHTYGESNKEYIVRTKEVVSLVNEFFPFNYLPIHMNEINTVPAPWIINETILEKPDMLPRILTMAEWLYFCDDIQVAHWAQFLSSGIDALGIVDVDGKIQPAFYAFEILARMNNNVLEVETEDNIGCIATIKEEKITAVCWNKSTDNINFLIHIKRKEYKNNAVNIYLINQVFLDKLQDNPQLSLEEARINICEICQVLNCSLERNDVLFIEET